ncbi:ATP-binding protein [bacterium]|nr:ATP-binding protein [bacterium]
MFQPATKYGSKLRGAFYGVSGAGKTYTALRVATGIGGRIAVICTEHGAARKYADRFNFDVEELREDRSIDRYLDALKAAVGYNVTIIDSMSHAWQELLTENDQLAKSRFRGNTFQAWSDSTPKQRRFIETILECPYHVIATLRSNTEWQTTSADGKFKPVRIGTKPEQGKGIEFEFDFLLELSAEHIGTVVKDRTGRYQDAIIDKPDEKFGAELAAWLADGALPPPRPTHIPPRAASAPATPTTVKPPTTRY